MVLYWVTIGARSTKDSVSPAGQQQGNPPSDHKGVTRYSTRGPAPIITTTTHIKSNGVLSPEASQTHHVDHVLERAHRERLTQFSDPGSRQPVGVVRIDDMRKSVRGGFVSGIAGKVKSVVKGSNRERMEPEEHTMSVQVGID